MRISIGTHGQGLTARQIANACGGKLVCESTLENTLVNAFCTDSREASVGAIFAAIRGERVDGHDYIVSAVELGCSCFLCERIPELKNVSCDGLIFIVVADTVSALGDIARSYMRTLSCRCVGVTGSVGKTTTKEMLSCILSQVMCVHKTQGNFNSNIGLPLVMLETPQEAEVNVLEMGTGEAGDIKYLSELAAPDAAVITNIGSAHIEAFGSRMALAREKLDVTRGMPEGSVLVINADDPYLMTFQSDTLKIIPVSLCSESAPIRSKNIRRELLESHFDIVDQISGEVLKDCTVRVPGDHNIYAALLGYALARHAFGVSADDIRRGIGIFHNTGLRQNIVPIGKNMLLIEDCYNASPESVKASLEAAMHMKRTRGSRLVAVLGDMLALGKESDAMHYDVGKAVAQLGVDILVAFGERALNIARGAAESGMSVERILTFESITDDGALECARSTTSFIGGKDIVLVKASRAIKAERISEYIKLRFENFGAKRL